MSLSKLKYKYNNYNSSKLWAFFKRLSGGGSKSITNFSLHPLCFWNNIFWTKQLNWNKICCIIKVCMYKICIIYKWWDHMYIHKISLRHNFYIPRKWCPCCTLYSNFLKISHPMAVKIAAFSILCPSQLLMLSTFNFQINIYSLSRNS